MSLGQHLVELRKRLTVAAVSIIVASVGGWFLQPFVISQLTAPLTEAAKLAHRSANLNFQLLTGAFDVEIQVAITIGVVVSSPVWLYQIWAFIVPGLKSRERRYVYGFLGTAIPLFLIGCCAGWIIMPHMVQLLTSLAPDKSTSLINGDDYVNFITKLIIAVGVGFVLPVFMVMLNFIGVMSARTILRGWRVAVLLICIFTAIVTPAADVVSMLVLAAPIIALYFAAALIAHLHDRSVARRAAQFEAEIAI
ncbi:MAG: twin arginine-targeting protein translocase TatC [Glaciihabitans sp.]|jgi:sec-independent protein translocase protein TatC|nr:twin arginine-targeting protein translocase TatC [Glaciihabitans sp.]